MKRVTVGIADSISVRFTHLRADWAEEATIVVVRFDFICRDVDERKVGVWDL